MTSNSAISDAALGYAALGWRVVPLHGLTPACTCGKPCGTSAGKHPRIGKWQVEASSDAAQVAAWWAKWPNSNVGIALGTGSGIVSIDIDSEAGEAVVLDLAGNEGLPATLEMTTSAGRRRLLFAIPESLEGEPVTIAVTDPAGGEAVRFQSSGAQCVMPPSRHHSGVRYAWVPGRSPTEIEPAPMPAWLIRKMTPDKPTVPMPAPSGTPNGHSQPQSDVPEIVQRFNAEADWLNDILIPAGWKLHTTRPDGVIEVTRPGKSGGCSATIGHHKSFTDGTPALHVFTGSVPLLPANHAYDKFGAYARLFHDGDTVAAIRALAATGRFGRLRVRADRAAEATPTRSVPIPEPWPKIIPLESLLKVPEFPLEVFPQALVDLVGQAADCVGCPVDYGASHALGVAAGAISGTFDLEVKRGHWQTTNLWVCVVAPPGSGKSPAVAPILAPVYSEQSRRNSFSSGQPVFVSNVTCEKLARMLQDHDRGLLMVWDEMAGWLTSFNQYKSGGGNDRAHYLSIWDGRALKVDRVNKDSLPIFVRYPRLSLVGGIQPDVLNELKSGPSDGLFDRMLFVYPDDRGLPVENFLEVADSPREAWKAALRKLWDLPVLKDETDRCRPKNITLNDTGRDVWQAWTKELHDRCQQPDVPDYFRQLAAKMIGYAARLALVVHLVHEAYNGGGAYGVGAVPMRHGVTLARYFLAHAERVYCSSGRDQRIAGAKAVLRWVIAKGERTHKRRDMYVSLHGSRFQRSQDLDEPLDLLTERGYLRRLGDSSKGPGRPSGGAFEVNPALFGRDGILSSAHAAG